MAYTHGESLLEHREHRGVCRSHANFDFAQALQDLRSVLRIVCIGMHDSDVSGMKCSEGDSASLKVVASLPFTLEIPATLPNERVSTQPSKVLHRGSSRTMPFLLDISDECFLTPKVADMAPEGKTRSLSS